MAQKSIQINTVIAERIKQRRIELNLTIEEAAKKAKVGTKTWYRYESGESIRLDKYKGVCKALNWINIPIDNEYNTKEEFDLNEYKNHEAWSSFLYEKFNEIVAASFAIGSDIVLDYIEQDMDELTSRPKGTHIGQLDFSLLKSILPEQFLMYYDYDFLYIMRYKLISLRKLASSGREIIAHTVLDELLLKIIAEESENLIEDTFLISPNNYWKDWQYELFDDDDIAISLYSGIYLTEADDYHFSNWLKEQFYCNQVNID